MRFQLVDRTTLEKLDYETDNEITAFDYLLSLPEGVLIYDKAKGAYYEKYKALKGYCIITCLITNLSKMAVHRKRQLA